MLNISVLSFYDNFTLIFKGSENMTTKDIKNWALSTSPLSIEISLDKNPSEYPYKAYIAEN